jgi:uncharacterized surface protein with fasciclin (FAS1) repeats
VFKKSILTLACATLFASVAAAAPPERTTIADAAIGNPAFSTLVAAVIKADLVAVLDGNRQLTVFAPTNDAFDAAAAALIGPGATGTDLVEALPVEDLTAVLLYHVSPGKRLATDVLNSKKVRMLGKNFTMPSVDAGGAAFINDAPIEAADIVVDNGVIHVLGGVLLPPAE